MDFIKEAAQKELVNNVMSNFSGKEENKNSGDNNNNNKDDSKSEQKSSGKYDSYISKGVDYAEEKFMHTDVKNKSDSVKSRDEKITSFISSNIDKFNK